MGSGGDRCGQRPLRSATAAVSDRFDSRILPIAGAAHGERFPDNLKHCRGST
jgi:hypothetical protein